MANKGGENITWGIAGRSETKLQSLKNELQLSDNIACFVADSSNSESLISTFSQTKLVLNCTGPYRFLGEPVVSSCIQSHTNYMDICGEPQFIEDMFLKYHDMAVKENVLILHACAFDSVPADLGFLYTMSKFPPNCCNSIESFLSINTGESGLAGHYTTFECAVHGMGDVSSLHRIRQNISNKYPNLPRLTPPGRKIDRYTGISYDERMEQYVIPFMGADAAIVRSTARSISMLQQNTDTNTNEYKEERDVKSNDNSLFIWPQYAAYACVGQWNRVTPVALYGGLFSTLSGFEYGRSLLLSYPEFFTGGIFSHNGPTKQQLDETSFDMLFIAKGWDSIDEKEKHPQENKIVKVKIHGPEPGYVATPIIFVILANILLQEYPNDNTASSFVKGGVYTPGVVFRHFSDKVIDNLDKEGVTFTTLENP